MLWLVLAALCVTLSAVDAHAQERSADSAEVVVVAYIGGEADQEAGRAVIAEAYRRLGLRVEFRALGAAEALEASRSGAADAELQRVGGLDPDAQDLIQVQIPVNFLHGAVFSRKYAFPVSWNNLKPYRIGIVRGIVFSEENTRGMTVRVAEDLAELVRWVAEDEVAVAVAPRIAGQRAIRAAGLDDVHELEGVLETLLLYHYVNARRPDLAERLTPVLKQMLLDGTTRRILDVERERVMREAP